MEGNNENSSLSSLFKAIQQPEPAPVQQPQASTPTAPPPFDNDKLSALEKAVSELRAELAELKKPERRAESAAQPAGRDEKMDHQERSQESLGQVKAAVGDARTEFSGMVKELSLRISRQEKTLEDMGRRILEQENILQSAGSMPASAEAIELMRKEVDGVIAGFENLKQKMTGYAADFSAVERECRSSLGKMKGFVKAAEENPLSEKFNDYLNDSVNRLTAKLADAEVAMHAAVAGLAGRLNANEALYANMFAEAEERLKKAIKPEIKQLDSRLKKISDEVAWLEVKWY